MEIWKQMGRDQKYEYFPFSILAGFRKKWEIYKD